MADARGRKVTIRLAATSTAGEAATFRASGKTYDFLGWRRAYVEDVDEDDEVGARSAPAVGARGRHASTAPSSRRWATRRKPPARYTEASLVKELEERGIGRPSTYAAVIETIQARGYVWRKGTALVPDVDRVRRHEPARAALRPPRRLRLHRDDGRGARRHRARRGRSREVARTPSTSATARPGCASWSPTSSSRPIDPRGVSTIPIGDDDTGHEIVVRVGRYGPYVQRADDETASLPPEIAPDELTVRARARAHRAAVAGPEGARDRSRDRAPRVRAHRPLRPVRAARRAGSRLEEEAEAGVAVRVADARDRDARRGAAAARAAARRRHRRRRPRDRRVARPLRPVPEARRRRHPQPVAARSSCSRSRSPRPRRCSPSRSRGAAASRSRRSPSSARTPTPARRCACSKVATARTSPTGA